jgi:isoquinoline 1-oxidoreductase subunit beta
MGTTRRVVLGVFGGAGALVVGYALWPSHRLERDDALDARNGERFLGNWIKVGSDDTVTVVVPHCDMGTGIFTSLPQMAAEELDSDWSKVRVEQAPPDALFANGVLVETFLLGASGVSPAAIPAFLKGTVDNTFRMLAATFNASTQAPDFHGYGGVQVTGGSASVRATGVYGIRVAAAAAREMLVKAAAARWNVDPSECTTKSNRVIHAATGQSLGYGQLVTDAQKFTPSPSPALKPASEYKLVGKSIARIDIPNKVNGNTEYGIDVKQPGMLYAAIRISPVFGGKLMSVDTSAIDAKRGVKKVVRLDDAVVVVADRFWRARDAAAALNPIFDNAGNGKVTSAEIGSRQVSALAKSLKSDVKSGSGGDALAGQRVIEATYRVPYLSHAPMEPMNATAIYKDGKLEVWSGTQDGLGSRTFCAKTAGLPVDKVTFHLMPSGGAFGRRLPGQWNFLNYAVKTAMAMPGAPIKLVFTREQDMQHDYYRPAVISRFKSALDKNGKPLAWVNDYAGTGDKKADSEARIVYDIADKSISWAPVQTHVPTGPWRSVEASWHGFFIESFVDELAHAAGKDPLAYRQDLLQKSPRHLAVLNLAAEKAGWGTPLPAGHGRGIALVESFGSIVAHVAEVEVTKDGNAKVHRIVSAIDCGMAVNPDGVKAQIESGILYGLTAALFDEITIDKGAVVQSSFPDYEMVRLADCPEVEVHILESGSQLGGAGEPGVPPTAPAVANAIFAASGTRVRELPIKNHTLTAANTKTKAA